MSEETSEIVEEKPFVYMTRPVKKVLEVVEEAPKTPNHTRLYGVKEVK